jgi:preprotein translocase subunit SecF
VIFLALVAVFIAFRLEWRMAVSAIIAMLHDVVVSVGIYSIFQFLITPATVIAFLTILGYSLYDTVVVFDRVRENEAKVGSRRPLYADIVNVSMNQVLMRSLNTSFSAILPVLSLLVVGSWIMGQSALSEFAIALLIGMITGAYSSILIAVPILYWLKQTDRNWRSKSKSWAVGEELREMVMSGGPVTRRGARSRATEVVDDATAAPGAPAAASKEPVVEPSKSAAAVLSHPPRPRKKTRR